MLPYRCCKATAPGGNCSSDQAALSDPMMYSFRRARTVMRLTIRMMRHNRLLKEAMRDFAPQPLESAFILRRLVARPNVVPFPFLGGFEFAANC